MPVLIKSHDSYQALAALMAAPGVHWMADAFNRQWLVATVGEKALVQSGMRPASAQQLIAVGGCSVRDHCALLAHEWNVPWSYIPSILSTDCIGVNRSVQYENGRSHSVVVESPNAVHINFALLRSGGEGALRKWCAAGLGDLFACISAAIHQTPMATTADILAAVPAAAEALLWLQTIKPVWTDEELARLAHLLLASSLEVVEAGSTALSAAGEHQLYYTLRRQEGYCADTQPHGTIVSIGALMTVWSYGDQQLFTQMRTAYRAVGLPTTTTELESILSRLQLLRALSTISKDSFLAQSFATHGEALLDRCFSNS